MKLADFQDNEALELLEKILDPVCTIMSDQKVTSMWKRGKRDVFLAQAVIKNHKKEIVEIIAAMHKEDPGDVHFTLPSLLKDVMDLINDPDLDAVFTLQGQRTEGESSGSAMGTIAAMA